MYLTSILIDLLKFNVTNLSKQLYLLSKTSNVNNVNANNISIEEFLATASNADNIESKLELDKPILNN
jgi:hypothetical protein